MPYVRLETQGESHVAIVNTDQVTYLAEGIYGTAVHLTSGDYLVCVGELAEVAEKLFGTPGARERRFMLAGDPAAT